MKSQPSFEEFLRNKNYEKSDPQLRNATSYLPFYTRRFLYLISGLELGSKDNEHNFVEKINSSHRLVEQQI